MNHKIKFFVITIFFLLVFSAGFYLITCVHEDIHEAIANNYGLKVSEKKVSLLEESYVIVLTPKGTPDSYYAMQSWNEIVGYNIDLLYGVTSLIVYFIFFYKSLKKGETQ